MEKCRERGLSVAETPLLRVANSMFLFWNPMLLRRCFSFKVYEKISPKHFDQTVEDAKRRFLTTQKATQEGSPQKILLLLVIHDRTDLYDDGQSTYGEHFLWLYLSKIVVPSSLPMEALLHLKRNASFTE